MDAIDYHRNALIADGDDPTEVEESVSLICQIQDENLLKEALANLELLANKLGWPRDKDYAALLLQHAADSIDNKKVRAAILGFALNRAMWCASAATAGGEGISRSRHVKELEVMYLECA